MKVIKEFDEFIVLDGGFYPIDQPWYFIDADRLWEERNTYDGVAFSWPLQLIEKGKWSVSGIIEAIQFAQKHFSHLQPKDTKATWPATLAAIESAMRRRKRLDRALQDLDRSGGVVDLADMDDLILKNDPDLLNDDEELHKFL